MDKEKVIQLTKNNRYITQSGFFDANGELVESIAEMEEEEFLKRFITLVGLTEMESSGDTEPGPEDDPNSGDGDDDKKDDDTEPGPEDDPNSGDGDDDKKDDDTEPGIEEPSTTEVATYDELVEALSTGTSSITLVGDITATADLNITADCDIDMNNCTITRADDTQAASAIIVNGPCTVNINGVGTIQSNGTSTSDWIQCIWVRDENAVVNINGNVAVKGGIWDNTEDHDTGSSAAIYCQYGKVNIYDGVYESGWAKDLGTGQYSVLNCLDASYKADTANIQCFGGTYKNFDPSNNFAEGEGTNFVAEGYTSTYNEGDGTYTVSASVEPATLSTKKTRKSKKA